MTIHGHISHHHRHSRDQENPSGNDWSHVVPAVIPREYQPEADGSHGSTGVRVYHIRHSSPLTAASSESPAGIHSPDHLPQQLVRWPSAPSPTDASTGQPVAATLSGHHGQVLASLQCSPSGSCMGGTYRPADHVALIHSCVSQEVSSRTRSIS